MENVWLKNNTDINFQHVSVYLEFCIFGYGRWKLFVLFQHTWIQFYIVLSNADLLLMFKSFAALDHYN